MPIDKSLELYKVCEVIDLDTDIIFEWCKLKDIDMLDVLEALPNVNQSEQLFDIDDNDMLPDNHSNFDLPLYAPVDSTPVEDVVELDDNFKSQMENILYDFKKSDKNLIEFNLAKSHRVIVHQLANKLELKHRTRDESIIVVSKGYSVVGESNIRKISRSNLIFENQKSAEIPLNPGVEQVLGKEKEISQRRRGRPKKMIVSNHQNH
ncbi:unnamed protein product [Brachionus calyciflorus]|uniref:R3H domain-containing protein n=1 Tax=Brachionus calyciflorus TaxID=104777 RepID=A0A814IMD6_9BILA|nr:unnamed protein product [Brachionus calyciflorus]